MGWASCCTVMAAPPAELPAICQATAHCSWRCCLNCSASALASATDDTRGSAVQMCSVASLYQIDICQYDKIGVKTELWSPFASMQLIRTAKLPADRAKMRAVSQ